MPGNYTVSLGEETEKLLGQIAKRKKITKAEAIRRAIASYAFLSLEEAEGRKIAVTNSEDRILKELVLP
jgi:hypothetical protein